MAQTPLPAAVSSILIEIFGSPTPALAKDMAGWMVASKRFRVFAEMYRDKIRKKVRSSPDSEGLRDLRCELVMAYLLLEEPRFAVQYELQGANKGRALDFTVTFRDNLTFHVEVTRLRERTDAAEAEPLREDVRLANTLCGKLGQMQAGALNLLVVFTEGHEYTEADVATTVKALLMLASNKVEAYFTWRGLRDSRDFLHQFQRLSGILLMASRHGPPGAQALFWENNQARHPVPGALLNSLRRVVSSPQTSTFRPS
jgi:hypothetical protein